MPQTALAVLEEAKLVTQFWLRSGNAPCASNVVGFTLELLSNLPPESFRGCAWSGPTAVFARTAGSRSSSAPAALHRGRGAAYKITSLLRKETLWRPSAVPGTDVAEVIYRGARWNCERRLILIRHRMAEKTRTGGRLLLDCPGYAHQALVTSLPASVSPIAVWRDYNAGPGWRT